MVGEDKIILGVYLAAISPLLGARYTVHVIVRGQSSTGKSFVVAKTLEALPEDCIEAIIGGSSKSLHYAEPDAFVERVLYLEEANCLIDTHSDLVVALRTLLTNGKMVYQTVHKDPESGEIKRVTRQLNGPMCFITTSTMMWIDEEMETRLLSLEANESNEQTRKIVKQMATQQGHSNEVPSESMADFRAYRKWLELGPRNVILGAWTVPLAEMIPDNVVRIRRDYLRLLALAAVSALIYQQHRPKTSQGAPIATLKDYQVARNVIAPTIGGAIEANLPEETTDLVNCIYRRIVDEHGYPAAVKMLCSWPSAAFDQGLTTVISTRQLAAALGLSTTTVRRRIGTLVDREILRRLDSGKRGCPMVLALGDLEPLCSDATDGVLPTMEKLETEMKQRGLDELSGTER